MQHQTQPKFVFNLFVFAVQSHCSIVYFSQCCVSEMKVFDQSLYVPIIVAKYDDHYTSYDNRRLLSARNVLKSNEDFRIRCEVQWWSTPYIDFP